MSEGGLPDSTRNVTPFLTGEPRTLCIYDSERADVFATHRLKSRLVLETGDVWLKPEELGGRLLSQARVEYLDGVQTAILEGDPAALPGASHSLDQSFHEPIVLDAWSAASGTWTLRRSLTSRTASKRAWASWRTPARKKRSSSGASAANLAYLIVIDQDGLEDELWAQGIDGALRKL